MANIQKILSDEIHRLAKKEAKSAMEPLKLQIAKLRAQIADQKEQIKSLQSKSAVTTVSADTAPSADPVTNEKSADDSKKKKLPGDKIKKIRKKLGLSQMTFAKLLGTCHNSIGRWESGFCQPNNDAKEKIAELAKLGKRELSKRIENLPTEEVPEQK